MAEDDFSPFLNLLELDDDGEERVRVETTGDLRVRAAIGALEVAKLMLYDASADEEP